MYYEFQWSTVQHIQQALQVKPIVFLTSDSGTGKSTILQALSEVLEGYEVIRCTGGFDRRHKDYGCLPMELLEEIQKQESKRALRNSALKDISGTIGNVLFLQTENIVDNLLSRTEEEDLEEIIELLMKKSRKLPIVILFDALSYIDYKSHVLLYSLISGIRHNRIDSIQLVVAADTEEQAELQLLQSLQQSSSTLVQTELPTDADLESIIAPSLVELGRCIPLKALLDIGNEINNIHYYLKEQLEKKVGNSILGEIVLLAMAAFEIPMTLADIFIFARNYDDYEIYNTMCRLKEIGLVERSSDTFDQYYALPEVYRATLLSHIPEYLFTNKLQIYIRYLEHNLEFNYYQKFLIYRKIEASENACINAVLAYCAYARDQLILSGEEVVNLKAFMESTHYAPLFGVIDRGYSMYCKEHYMACYIYLNTCLADNHFVSDKTIYCYSCSAEVILEIIYLAALSSLRLQTIAPAEVARERQRVGLALSLAKQLENEEFILRLREVQLLIEIEMAHEPTAYYFNDYFSICAAYHVKIRSAHIHSRVYWETRYAMHLLRINSISGVPDKLSIIHKGFEIARCNQRFFHRLYLRAACNYACDIMWRGRYDESYRILQEAVSFITANRRISHWGIVVQMYIFASLFAGKVSPSALLEEYNSLVWSNADIRGRMHEPYLCTSNYSMLLACNGQYTEAQKTLEETRHQCPPERLYEHYILTTNFGALAYLLGNTEEAIRLEMECSKALEHQTIPNFSMPFLFKRNTILLNIYKKNTVVDQVMVPLEPRQYLSTGYCSDHYTRLFLFSDINYWAN